MKAPHWSDNLKPPVAGGIAATDLANAPKGDGKINSRLADSLKRHADQVYYGCGRRDRDDEGMFAPLGGDTTEAQRLAKLRQELPTDQYGNVLDGGEMD